MSLKKRAVAAFVTAATLCVTLGTTTSAVAAPGYEHMGTCTGDYQLVSVFHNALWHYKIEYSIRGGSNDHAEWFENSLAIPFHDSGEFNTWGDVLILPTPSAWVYMKCAKGAEIYSRDSVNHV
ncbi:hypothetical protein [Streptomyces sp. NPDC048650]|uniref:hypothetical protein n=1 Tax=Streptomyces sp. NPDC048650 TaxID=3365583 RepID=UPI003724510A